LLTTPSILALSAFKVISQKYNPTQDLFQTLPFIKYANVTPKMKLPDKGGSPCLLERYDGPKLTHFYLVICVISLAHILQELEVQVIETMHMFFFQGYCIPSGVS